MILKKQFLTLKVIFILFVIPIISLYILSKPSYSFSPTSSQIYEGIDVSAWQGYIDYRKVKDYGIEIVYIKASEGFTLIDPYLEQNYTNARANNLKIGFYHYVTARNINDARTQADFFVNNISGKVADCKLAMDFESFGNLSVNEINEVAIAFIEEVEKKSGKKAVVYSNTNDARTVFYGNITNYPLWVAQYGVSEPTENGKWSSWVGWQYTSRGNVDGINGYVDIDIYYKK